jgi:hypothetical protein
VVPVSDISGPAKAACTYLLGAWEIHRFADHAGDTVIAGAFTHADDAYLKAYAALLAARVRAPHCAAAGVDAARTLGACVNGRPDRQVADAAGFLALPDAGPTNLPAGR